MFVCVCKCMCVCMRACLEKVHESVFVRVLRHVFCVCLSVRTYLLSCLGAYVCVRVCFLCVCVCICASI